MGAYVEGPEAASTEEVTSQDPEKKCLTRLVENFNKEKNEGK